MHSVMQTKPLLKSTRACLAAFMMIASLGFSVAARADDQSAAALDVTSQAASQAATGDTQKINHLLELIDQRLGFATDVAKSKWNAGTIIDDPEREKQVLESIAAQVKAMGIDNTAYFTVFFQNQIEAGKIIQARQIMHWHSEYPSDFKFKDAPSLIDDIRPKLDQLTPELIKALHDVQPLLAQPGLHAYLMNKSTLLIRNDVNGEVRRTALMSFDSE